MRFGVVVKYVSFVAKLAFCKAFARKMPLIAVLCVTNKCNLKCWYCYGEHPLRSGIDDFSTAELLNIVKKLKMMGTCILQLQGGEPLLRDDMGLVIKEARRLGMLCDMVTNGILVPEKRDVISLLDRVCISLDGPDLINDLNRGSGSFLKAQEAVKIARSLNLPVRINSVLTQDYKTEYVDWMVDFCNEHGALVNFCPSFNFSWHYSRDNCKPHDIPDERLRGLFLYIMKLKKKGAPIQFSAESYFMAARWPFPYTKRQLYKKDRQVSFNPVKCYHGDYIIFIDSDGCVYPCCNFWGKSRINIREKGLKKAICGLNREGCLGCYIPSYIDRNLIFGCRLRVWGNYLRYILTKMEF